MMFWREGDGVERGYSVCSARGDKHPEEEEELESEEFRSLTGAVGTGFHGESSLVMKSPKADLLGPLTMSLNPK